MRFLAGLALGYIIAIFVYAASGWSGSLMFGLVLGIGLGVANVHRESLRQKWDDWQP